jgi:hypothetical protein
VKLIANGPIMLAVVIISFEVLRASYAGMYGNFMHSHGHHFSIGTKTVITFTKVIHRSPFVSNPLKYQKAHAFLLAKKCVGFEVLTAVVMNSTIFWDIMPCSPLSVNRRFGGTYYLHLQGRKK